MAAKVIGSDSLNWAAGQLMQLLGGRGYMENNLAAQILRDARLYSVGEGPNEALTTQVGRKARLTDAIDGYLRASAAGAEPADMLATASGRGPGALPEPARARSPTARAPALGRRADRPGCLRRAAPGRRLAKPEHLPPRTGASGHRLGRGSGWRRASRALAREPRGTADADLLSPPPRPSPSMSDSIGDVEQALRR